MGVPMIVGGDEFMRSQGATTTPTATTTKSTGTTGSDRQPEESGNDSFLVNADQKEDKIHQPFQRSLFHRRTNKYGLSEVAWHGTQLNNPGWNDAEAHCFAVTYGDTAEDTDANIHCMFNMYWDGIDFELPQLKGLSWYRSIDTAQPTPNDIAEPENMVKITGNSYMVGGRSVVVLVSKPT